MNVTYLGQASFSLTRLVLVCLVEDFVGVLEPGGMGLKAPFRSI